MDRVEPVLHGMKVHRPSHQAAVTTFSFHLYLKISVNMFAMDAKIACAVFFRLITWQARRDNKNARSHFFGGEIFFLL